MPTKYHMLSNQKVLYVEDDISIREELVDILSLKIKELIVGIDGQDGLELYHKHKPDLIITDIRMPRLNGIEMIRKIRETNCDIPIIITSAFNDIDFLKESIELNVDKYITKPIDINLLFYTLNKLSLQVNQKKELDKKTRELERTHELLSNAVLYTTSDLKGNIASVSKAFEKFCGYKEKELIGKNHSIFKHKYNSNDIYKNMWDKLKNNEQFVGELKVYDKNRDEYWAKVTIDPLYDENGKKVGYGSYRENITDKKILEYISVHDSLTGIYNRGYFQKELLKKIKSAKRYNQQFGLILLDIDYFKSVNDTYGHQVGDDVLKKLAHCISSYVRDDDIAVRWGGEEFSIIANGATINDLKGLVEKLQLEIQKVSFIPVSKVTASFGLTIFKKDDDEESILKRVDDALYKAKENGRDKYEIL